MRRGFTLIEIAIVVTLIAILAMIAIPGFWRSRERTQQRTCVFNLRQIENAKDQLALANQLTTGSPVTASDLVPDYLKAPTLPRCPSGGTYTINPIGSNPTCSIQGGFYPHILP